MPRGCLQEGGVLNFALRNAKKSSHHMTSFGTRKRGVVAKGSFQSCPLSREFRDAKDFPECGKQWTIRPFSRDSRESEILGMITSHDVLEPLKQAFSASRDVIISGQIFRNEVADGFHIWSRMLVAHQKSTKNTRRWLWRVRCLRCTGCRCTLLPGACFHRVSRFLRDCDYKFSPHHKRSPAKGVWQKKVTKKITKLRWIRFKGGFLWKHLNPIRGPFLGDSVRILGVCPAVSPTSGP